MISYGFSNAVSLRVRDKENKTYKLLQIKVEIEKIADIYKVRCKKIRTLAINKKQAIHNELFTKSISN